MQGNPSPALLRKKTAGFRNAQTGHRPPYGLLHHDQVQAPLLHKDLRFQGPAFI